MSRREFEWVPDQTAARAIPADGRPGTISACLVVHHEESTIGRCLDSLHGVVDEIVVVHDGPCRDRTLAIAAGYGARVIEAPLYGHCERHTPLAYAEATGEWLLNLDADEFLSAALAARLGELVRDPDVDGYEFLWKHWDGERYVTEAGPYKLVLFRRRAARMVGLIHQPEAVDGSVRRVGLHLEHRPPSGHRTMGAMMTKWRRRARLHAREYVEPLDEVPRFNYPGLLKWTARRELTTRLAPLLVVPAALHTFGFVLLHLWRELGPREALRFATTEAVYRGMVTAWVAWYRYVWSPRRARAG
jgi:glycosyltransferase involved in cell wall biosynthesis